MIKITICFFSMLFFMFFLTSLIHSQTFDELITNYKKAQLSKDYDEMIEVCSIMIKKYPNNQPDVTYFNRGNAYRVLGEFKKAIQDYSNAIKIKQDFNDAYFNRGISYFRIEQYKKALSDFSFFINNVQDNPYAYFYRGNSYSYLYNYDSAVADYTKAIELKPDYIDAYYNRGNKYYGMEMYKEAIEDWMKVKKFDPKYESALQNKIDEAKEKLKEKK